ncbi:MAG: hypothetical protein ACAH83_06085 [Alphaproteobacteria bacterium]
MENDPNRDLNRDDRTYNKEDNSYSGWVIVGLIVFVIAAVALYQTRATTNMDDLTNIAPAAGSDNTVTNTTDTDNTTSPDNTVVPGNTTTP